MEIADNVRDFLVGMKESINPIEEEILSNLQQLHEQFTMSMSNFDANLSENALHMSPEARIVAHQLRIRIYQDWRSKLMECVFTPDHEHPVENYNLSVSNITHEEACDPALCTHNARETSLHSIENRLALYKIVTDHYIHVSTHTRRKPILTPMMLSPTSLHRQMFEQFSKLDVSEAEEIMFVIPDFLCESTALVENDV